MWCRTRLHDARVARRREGLLLGPRRRHRRRRLPRARRQSGHVHRRATATRAPSRAPLRRLSDAHYGRRARRGRAVSLLIITRTARESAAPPRRAISDRAATPTGATSSSSSSYSSTCRRSTCSRPRCTRASTRVRVFSGRPALPSPVLHAPLLLPDDLRALDHAPAPFSSNESVSGGSSLDQNANRRTQHRVLAAREGRLGL